MAKNLYKFRWDCGRQGSVESIFAADEEDVAKAVGQPVCFGEILGKHSDVSGVLEAQDLKALTDDAAFIGKFLALGCESGPNPLDHLEERDG